MAGQEKSSKKSPHERKSQKNRTRKALIAAAGELIRAGTCPTVGNAAETAGISRATAYRYFPNQEMLVSEVALFEVGGPLSPAAESDLPVPEAVGRFVRRVGDWSYDHEQPLRTLLRLSLDPDRGVRRPGYRLEWITEMLSPAQSRIDAKTYRVLANALTLLMGIDPVVVMTDIAGVSRQEALDTLEWCGKTLVKAALREGRDVSRR